MTPIADARERGGGGGRQASNDRGARGGGRDVQVNNNKRDARSTNVRNTSVNSVNVNKNVNVNIDNDRHGGWDNDHHHHPIATAAAVTATVAVTAAIVGSIVNTVPSGCVATNYNGVIYQQCGGSWYQPQYVGSTVQYVVINSPY
jgi:hypothetical protein